MDAVYDIWTPKCDLDLGVKWHAQASKFHLNPLLVAEIKTDKWVPYIYTN